MRDTWAMTEERFDASTMKTLERVPDLIERARLAADGVGQNGSIEAEDRLSPVGHHVTVLAGMKLAIAGDHLLGFYLIAHGTRHIPTWSHLTLLRGATEAAMDVRWLTDPASTSQDRVARAVGRMLYDYEQRALAEDELAGQEGWPRPGYVDARARHAELIAEATAAGVFPAGYPGSTNLARTFAECGLSLDAFNFRYMSGVQHGVVWAGVRGDHSEVVEPSDPTDPVNRVLTTASSSGTWYATRCATHHFVSAIESIERYLAPADNP